MRLTNNISEVNYDPYFSCSKLTYNTISNLKRDAVNMVNYSMQ